ncbi:hypothetical protein RUMOBE_00471 [Blautia obeum ATCC 29174]|uniref:Uncharacterized protein n=1 Tax=Blautia obeum ATCC 29174 TaxID=411459 RepID=A5ZNA4_9FIRM|nr:hypothetical protein RUMOBE_00471 [Blautia obeum ATCC 29174]
MIWISVSHHLIYEKGWRNMTGKNRKFCYENHNLMSMKSRKQTLKTGVYQIFCLGIKRNDENTDCIKC